MKDKHGMERLDLIVNAGGQSRRMGRTKALLSVPPDEYPLIVYIIRRLIPLATGSILVVTGDTEIVQAVDSMERVRIVSDRWANAGALGGIASGLFEVSGWAMVVACDMPLVDQAIFRKLTAIAERKPEIQAIVPRIGGQPQPFHALWHRTALPLLECCISAGALGVQDALAKLPVCWIDEAALGVRGDHPAFFNANTPSEWEAIRSQIQQQKGR